VRRGFTIIELVMVIAILGILLGIVTTAAASAIKQAREKKAATCCKIVQAAFETYYAQKGEWPGGIDSELRSRDTGNGNNCEIARSEVDKMMRDILREYKNGNPCLDISGLFVSRSGAEPRGEHCPICGLTRYFPAKGAYGLDFMVAIRGTKKDANGQRMTTSQMHFGYPHKVDGRFMPFRVFYSKLTDRITVEQWHWEP
jgi:prepilin-type N-terminal cleavage/methylation domain-containing protein